MTATRAKDAADATARAVLAPQHALKTQRQKERRNNCNGRRQLRSFRWRSLVVETGTTTDARARRRRRLLSRSSRRRREKMDQEKEREIEGVEAAEQERRSRLPALRPRAALANERRAEGNSRHPSRIRERPVPRRVSVSATAASRELAPHRVGSRSASCPPPCCRSPCSCRWPLPSTPRRSFCSLRPLQQPLVAPQCFSCCCFCRTAT